MVLHNFDCMSKYAQKTHMIATPICAPRSLSFSHAAMQFADKPHRQVHPPDVFQSGLFNSEDPLEVGWWVRGRTPPPPEVLRLLGGGNPPPPGVLKRSLDSVLYGRLRGHEGGGDKNHSAVPATPATQVPPRLPASPPRSAYHVLQRHRSVAPLFSA